jgi:hypothetical protein
MYETNTVYNTVLAECVFYKKKGNREEGAACVSGKLISLSQVQENLEF